MKLTSLEIQGFKSFADRTKFAFSEGITGIVGPNGCGKSNVIDAIRWVLGEQKTRTLRSEKMENVIFNGTDKRKKAGLAEVSITFENTRNLLPTEYTTVSVTRRLHRDGESEYFINNVPCRLKDITTLFLDTGIGSDSYSIIELGMVDDILSDKNNSRRQLFEEAAGISRYKLRKKETLTRLEDTDKSLERVEDVLFEIEKTLKATEKQAKRAEQYFELREQYRCESLRVAHLRYLQLSEVIEGLEAFDQTLYEQISQHQAAIAAAEARVMELRHRQLDRETALQDRQKHLNDHLENIRKLENERNLRTERLKYLQQREVEVYQTLQRGKDWVSEIEHRLKQLEIQIDVANEEYDKQEFLLVELENELNDLRTAVQNRRLQLDEVSAQLRSKENQLQQLQRERDMTDLQIDGLLKELTRAESDRESRQMELEGFTDRTTTLNNEITALHQDFEKVQAKKKELETAINQTNLNIAASQDALNKLRRTIDAHQHDYNLTREMVENLEGFPESVRFLKQNLPQAKNAPFVSDLFYTEPAYKVTVENYLEPYLNYYVVNKREDALEGIRLLQKASRGRANFFIMDEIRAFYQQNPISQEIPEVPPPVAVKPVLALVEVPEEYRPLAYHLLNNVYLLEGELPHHPIITPKVTLIHQSGAIIARRFSTGGGSIGLFEGKRIGRAQNLEKLQAEIKTLSTQAEAEENKLKDLKTKLNELLAQNVDKELQTINLALVQKKQEASILVTRAEENKTLLSRIGSRAVEVEHQIRRLQKLLENLDRRIETLTDEVHELQAATNTHARELNNRTDQFNEVNAVYNSENIKFLNIKNKIEVTKRDFRAELEKLNNIGSQENALKQDLEQIRNDIAELSHNKHDFETQLLALYTQKEGLEEGIRAIEAKVVESRAETNAIEQTIRLNRQARESLEQQRNTNRDRVTEIRIQINNLHERISVEWQTDLQSIDVGLLFSKPLDAYNLEEVEAGMLRLREKYTKFGEVNTTAIETYREMKERYDFINRQKEDLIQAKKDLLQTIREIDTTAREKFMVAFTAIREHFIRVFRSLFTENDTCDLFLVNPDDPLESPIEITARPKGKRPLTINQLSGGEKTLTAISLLFAIYLLKPAPFCIFDEVDAPLDDANIDKFNNIMQQFSGQSQFIIVTHNKRTMVKTQIIYGVTMEETGVSRVLPVDLEALNLN